MNDKFGRNIMIALIVTLFIMMVVFILTFNEPSPHFTNLSTAMLVNSTGNTSGYWNNSEGLNLIELHSYYSPYSMYTGSYEPKSILLISNDGIDIMIIYPNGTIWIKEGQEQLSAEQLAKFTIGYFSYLNGYCEGRK